MTTAPPVSARDAIVWWNDDCVVVTHIADEPRPKGMLRSYGANFSGWHIPARNAPEKVMALAWHLTLITTVQPGVIHAAFMRIKEYADHVEKYAIHVR